MAVSSLADLGSVRDYLNRINAIPTSLRSAVIREQKGQYQSDRVTIRFSDTGEVSVYENSRNDDPDDSLKPTDIEAKAILDEWSKIKWPQPKLLPRLHDMPPAMQRASADDLFIFREFETQQINFVQVRGEDENGEKHYWPWTYFDDGVWRQVYPSWKLPLFNAHLMKNASVVFLHEGAKAARRVQEMIEGKTPEARERLLRHPWRQELAAGVHVGWIGGAPNPHRTDWTPFEKAGIKRVYIVTDNDIDGKQAVPKIARNLNMPGFSIEFTNEFPPGFDLGDDFPEDNPRLFGCIDGEKFYRGPTMRTMLHPATWATEKIVTGQKGRPSYRLRESFMAQWDYVEEVDQFVCNEFPEIMRSETILNKMLAPFSDVAETTRLMFRDYHGRNVKLAYKPGEEGRLVTFRGSSALNLHVPSEIRAARGNPAPFIEFMEYLFPNEKERHEMMRWCATLIARPGVRIGYGILLVSRMQGVGKTTLASMILAPLVGLGNVSFPSETDINNQFNSWVAYKRLAIVNEIYSGHSWKAYHSLKSVITDRDIDVNQKFMRQFTIENWCHVFACSNSERPLKMENDDRRWFYPRVTEVVWDRKKFDDLYLWLQSGGLSIIKQWAEDFGDYCSPSDRAPMTERKKELIEGSRSDAQADAAAVAEMMLDHPAPCAVLLKDVVEYARSKAHGKVFDSDLELRKAMTDVGVHLAPCRVKVDGRYHYSLMNHKLMNIVQTKDTEKEMMALIRDHRVKPDDLFVEVI